MKRFTLSILFFLSYASFALAQRVGLSPFTRRYLHAVEMGAKTSDPLRGFVYKQAPDGSLLLSAFLQIEPSFSEEMLTPLGVRIGTKAGNIWTAQIPPASLHALTQLQGLRYIQLDEPIVQTLDSTRRVTRVDSVHRGLNLPQAFTGQGVVVGVIDAGFDYGHPVLFDTTGTGYRVKRIWEQKKLGTPPAGYAYGREITDSSAMWMAGKDMSYGSHGQHVAGIAAGSGAGGPGGSARFRGVAYRSDLVLVGIWPPEAQWTGTGVSDVVDGIAYIFNYAASVGKPAVVNLSWGGLNGPGDGSSLFSQAVDNLVGPGKIFCASAGNSGSTALHVGKAFTPADTLLRTVVNLPTALLPEKPAFIDVWADTAETFCARITLYNGLIPVDSTALICLDNSLHTLKVVGSDGDTCFISASTETASFNDKPRTYIYLNNYSANTVCLSLKSTAANLHAWTGYFRDGIGYTSTFTSGLPGATAGNTEYTISDLASTKHTIAVGAFTSKRSFTNVSGTQLSYSATQNALATFSSKGPSVDGRFKPDIAAPGFGVASSVSSYDSSVMPTGADYNVVVHNYVHPTNGRTYPFAMKAGTSMASPAVAGIVALMLQAAPGLTPQQVRDILAETAMRDQWTGTYPAGVSSNTWGAGKVNAYRALKRVLELQGVQDVGAPTLSCLLFPNPGRGQFSLEVEESSGEALEITVQDITGRTLRAENWKPSRSRTKTFDWSELMPGTYLVRVEGGAKSAVMKMVVR